MADRFSITGAIGDIVKNRKEAKRLEAERPGKTLILQETLASLGVSPEASASFLTPGNIDQFKPDDIIDMASDAAKAVAKKKNRAAGGIFFEGGRLVNIPPEGVVQPGVAPTVPEAPPEAVPTAAAVEQVPAEVARPKPAEARAKALVGPEFQTEKITFGPSGELKTGTAERVRTNLERKKDLQEIQEKGEIETQKQVTTQQEKDLLKSEQNLVNAQLKIGNTMDGFLDVVQRTKELTGVDPGVASGLITSVLGRARANEFFPAFRGGLTEYAAAIGRIAIPGARATRLVNLFKQTAPTTFDTIPSAINTAALSFKNGIATDMSRAPWDYLESFKDLKTEKERRNAWNNLTRPEKLAATNTLSPQLRDFEKTYREGLYKLAFKKDPALVPTKDRERIIANAPKFNTVDEINSAGLPKGTIIIFRGEPAEVD